MTQNFKMCKLVEGNICVVKEFENLFGRTQIKKTSLKVTHSNTDRRNGNKATIKVKYSSNSDKAGHH